jgi:hypothetical protein
VQTAQLIHDQIDDHIDMIDYLSSKCRCSTSVHGSRLRVEDNNPTDKVSGHATGPTTYIIEREVVILLSRYDVVQNYDVLCRSVDPLYERACYEQIRQPAFIEQPDNMMTKRSRNTAMMDANTRPKSLADDPVWVISLAYPVRGGIEIEAAAHAVLKEPTRDLARALWRAAENKRARSNVPARVRKISR